jgi:hypothetical protein
MIKEISTRPIIQGGDNQIVTIICDMNTAIKVVTFANELKKLEEKEKK